MYQLPKRARLRGGTRVLHPLHGTFFRYGGRWVSVKGWTENGQIIVRTKDLLYFLVYPYHLNLPLPTMIRGEQLDMWDWKHG